MSRCFRKKATGGIQPWPDFGNRHEAPGPGAILPSASARYRSKSSKARSVPSFPASASRSRRRTAASRTRRRLRRPLGGRRPLRRTGVCEPAQARARRSTRGLPFGFAQGFGSRQASARRFAARAPTPSKTQAKACATWKSAPASKIVRPTRAGRRDGIRSRKRPRQTRARE